jgi:hypothetical protein
MRNVDPGISGFSDVQSRISGSLLQTIAGIHVGHLDEKPARPYSRAHDQRCDHCHRSPPPLLSGMGGRLRLRSSPLPPDPVRGHFLT